MSKSKIPPEWNPRESFCHNCEKLKRDLDIARLKIQEYHNALQVAESKLRPAEPQLPRPPRISPTARMAAIWAQQNEAIERGETDAG